MNKPCWTHRLRRAGTVAGMLLALPLLPALATVGLHAPLRHWQLTEPITPQALRDALAAGSVVVIDARPEEAFATGHIPGAIPLTDKNWTAGLRAIRSRVSRKAFPVVYCGSASCTTARQTARRLSRDLGIVPVCLLEGGWEAWQQDPQP